MVAAHVCVGLVATACSQCARTHHSHCSRKMYMLETGSLACRVAPSVQCLFLARQLPYPAPWRPCFSMLCLYLEVYSTHLAALRTYCIAPARARALSGSYFRTNQCVCCLTLVYDSRRNRPCLCNPSSHSNICSYIELYKCTFLFRYF